MKTKAAKIFSDCKYGLIVFILLTVQAVMNMIPFREVGEYLHVYYLVDFSMGKTSRLLIGSIVNWLTDSPTVEWVNKFVVVSIFLMIILVSVFAGKVINSVMKELKPQMFIFALFFVSGSLTFANFSKFIGFLDVYMFIVALVAVAFLCNRYLCWFVPILCVVGVFIHQGFVISYFPLVILASFYMAFTQEKKAEKKAVFVLSAVLTVAAVLFCAVLGTKTITLPYEEMCEIVNERASREFSDTALFNLGFYFYNHAPSETGISTEQLSNMSLWEILVTLFNFTNYLYLDTFRGLVAIMSLTLLMFALFWMVWIKCAKNAETKGKKFVYVCFMLFTLIVPLYCLIAVDYIRWIQAGMLTQFGLAFLMFYMKDEPFEKTMVQLKEYFSNKKLLLLIIYLVYALAVQRDLTA